MSTRAASPLDLLALATRLAATLAFVYFLLPRLSLLRPSAHVLARLEAATWFCIAVGILVILGMSYFGLAACATAKIEKNGGVILEKKKEDGKHDLDLATSQFPTKTSDASTALRAPVNADSDPGLGNTRGTSTPKQRRASTSTWSPTEIVSEFDPLAISILALTSDAPTTPEGFSIRAATRVSCSSTPRPILCQRMTYPPSPLWDAHKSTPTRQLQRVLSDNASTANTVTDSTPVQAARDLAAQRRAGADDDKREKSADSFDWIWLLGTRAAQSGESQDGADEGYVAIELDELTGIEPESERDMEKAGATRQKMGFMRWRGGKR
uniref:Uncharacterized protein n=1 Tax=Mycena chlorophos TaxID=658473 RepID=A0ABQ0LM39_MYCCL|nr:predicted protein [Mycena chlorophos]